MKKEYRKIAFATFLTFAALIFGASSFNVKPSNATFSASPTPSCGTFVYEFSNDGNNGRVDVNFESSDNQITVSGINGWTVTKVELDVENDNHSGYFQYSTSNLSNFNPNPGNDIDEARVTVTKSCATPTATATVTSQPTNVPTATATQEGKVYWCHYEPNGNHQTLHLPMSALTNAGHVNANGNPLHAGDHAGECVDPTATATSQPTSQPTETSQPSSTPSGDPTSTPEATASATPNGDICANLDGIQLTMPDEYHHDNDKVNCLKFELGGPPPPSNTGGSQVLGASTTGTGKVLGASTMAGTGAVEDSIFYSLFSLGSLLTSFGIMKNGKKKN